MKAKPKTKAQWRKEILDELTIGQLLDVLCRLGYEVRLVTKAEKK